MSLKRAMSVTEGVWRICWLTTSYDECTNFTKGKSNAMAFTLYACDARLRIASLKSVPFSSVFGN